MCVPEMVELLSSLLAPLANHALLLLDGSDKEYQERNRADCENLTENRQIDEVGETKGTPERTETAQKATKSRESPTKSADSPNKCDGSPEALPQTCVGPQQAPDSPADHLYPAPIDWETAAVHGTPLCPHTERLLAGRRVSSGEWRVCQYWTGQYCTQTD